MFTKGRDVLLKFDGAAVYTFAPLELPVDFWYSTGGPFHYCNMTHLVELYEAGGICLLYTSNSCKIQGGSLGISGNLKTEKTPLERHTFFSPDAMGAAFLKRPRNGVKLRNSCNFALLSGGSLKLFKFFLLTAKKTPRTFQ